MEIRREEKGEERERGRQEERGGEGERDIRRVGRRGRAEKDGKQNNVCTVCSGLETIQSPWRTQGSCGTQELGFHY